MTNKTELINNDFSDDAPKQHFCESCGFPDPAKLPRAAGHGVAVRLPFTWQQPVEIHCRPWSMSFTLFLTEHGSAAIEWVHRISNIDVSFDLGSLVIKAPLEKPIILGRGQAVKVIASTKGHSDRGVLALAGSHFIEIIPSGLTP